MFSWRINKSGNWSCCLWSSNVGHQSSGEWVKLLRSCWGTISGGEWRPPPAPPRGGAVNIKLAKAWEPTLLHTNPPTSHWILNIGNPTTTPYTSRLHIADNPLGPCQASSHASVVVRRKERRRNGAFMEIRLSTIFPIRYGNITQLATPAGRPCSTRNICSTYSGFSDPRAQSRFEPHSDLFAIWILVC